MISIYSVSGDTLTSNLSGVVTFEAVLDTGEKIQIDLQGNFMESVEEVIISRFVLR